MFPASRGLLLPLILKFPRCFKSPSSGRRCLQHHKFHRFDLTDPSTMNHTHMDNIFSSVEGATTPTLKKCAVYPIHSVVFFDVYLPSLPSYRQHIFQYRGGYYPNTEKLAVDPRPSGVFFDVLSTVIILI